MLFLRGLLPEKSRVSKHAIRYLNRVLVPAFTLSCCLLSVSLAQDRAPLTIMEAEELALVAEPGQQELRARAAALNARAVVAGELPEPTLRVGLNNYPFESGGFSTEGMTHAALGFRQTFPAGRSRSIAFRQFEASAEVMLENADARGRNVLTNVRVAWLNVYYWNQVQSLVSSSRPYFDDLVSVTLSLYSVGRKSQQDVLRAQLELSRLDDRLIEVERKEAQWRSVLSEWIGENAIRPIAEKLPAWNQTPPIETLESSLLQHPMLTASEAQIAAWEAGVELANEGSKPDWSVDVGYSYRDGSLPSGQPRSDFVSLNFTIGMPFFRKKAVDGNLTAALQERSAAKSSKQKTVRKLQSDLQTEYALFRDLTRRLQLYESQILRLSESHAEASLLAYQSDNGDFADVMRANVDDLDTRIQYIRLQVERAQTYAALANLGGLQR
jgi:outer membrane protein TolC